jgi:phage terminase small subunit
MKNGELTDKQKAFADYYIIYKNATKAAKLAGYRGNDVVLASVGSENLRKPKIRAYIDRAFQERVMSRNEVLVRLTEIATGSAEDYLSVDPHDSRIATLDIGRLINDGKGHLVRRYSHTKNGVVVELHSAHEALRDIAKYHQLFGDEARISVQVKLVTYLREGRIRPQQVLERWPNLAEQLFAEAGINVDH